VLTFARTLGSLSGVKVQDMQEQRRELLAMEQPAPPTIAIVAVVSGYGMERVYQSLGVHVLIPGGATLNPSVDEIASAIRAAPSDQVLLLTNNGNVIPGAQEAISILKDPSFKECIQAASEG